VFVSLNELFLLEGLNTMSPRPATATRATETTEEWTAEGKSPAEIKAHYEALMKADLAKAQEGRSEKIKAMRQEVIELLEGSGITLREVWMYGDGTPKEAKADRPKPGKYKINGQWRTFTATSRKTGDAKDYDFAGAEARGEYRPLDE